MSYGKQRLEELGYFDFVEDFERSIGKPRIYWTEEDEKEHSKVFWEIIKNYDSYYNYIEMV